MLVSVTQKRDPMVWFVVMQVFSTLLEWVRMGRKTEQEKDLEILVGWKNLDQA